MAVNEIFFDHYPDSILEHQIQVRPFNALKTKNMRNLNPEGDIFNRKILYMEINKTLFHQGGLKALVVIVVMMDYKSTK